jgi:hypothetical protein
MTPAEALLANLRSRGIELETDGTRIRWRPAFMVTAPQVEQIGFHRGELMALLANPGTCDGLACPACRWPMDAVRRCPKCFDRLCVDCGRMTGSYFIMRCVLCGFAVGDD